MTLVALEQRVPVGRLAGVEEELETAVSIFHRKSGADAGAPIAFAFPGAGYSRRYYDMHVPGFAGYSMAEHWVAAGGILVACDHVGAGDSTLPAAEVSPDLTVAANDLTVRRVVELLATLGVTGAGERRLIGIGHSMGGHLVTRQQANHSTFDAIAVLGWSAEHSAIRHPDGTVVTNEEAIAGWQPLPANELPERYRELSDGYLYLRPRPPLARWAFYPDDVPDAVVAADEEAMSVIAPGVAERFPEPGFGRSAASRIDVPVFLAFGETRDIAANPRLEPLYYTHARDVTLYLLPGSAHCHNFAPQRATLWERLAAWAAVSAR
jgi:pimeloyl-ACP methyl ester carboxylesterase